MLTNFMTIAEMLRRADSALQALVIQTFSDSVFLSRQQFRPVTGAGADFRQITGLPTPQRRGLNAEFSRTRGTHSPGHEAVRLYGTRMNHDRAGVQMGIYDPFEDTEASARAVRLLLESDAISGDPSSNALQVGGLQFWAENSGRTSDTSISAGSTAGGAALGLKLLRDAIDNCVDPQGIVLSKSLRNLLTGAAHNTAVGGFITWSTDEFGRRIAEFDDLPLIPLDRDHNDSLLLPFAEAAASGSATATSLYIIGGGSNYYWFQNGMPRVDPINGESAQRVRDLEWIVGCVAPHPRAVVRVKHIGNLPVVA